MFAKNNPNYPHCFHNAKQKPRPYGNENNVGPKAKPAAQKISHEIPGERPDYQAHRNKRKHPGDFNGFINTLLIHNYFANFPSKILYI
jgi:hypothetical protein